MHLPQAIRYHLASRSRRGLLRILRQGLTYSGQSASASCTAGLQKMDKEPIDLRDRAAELAPLTRLCFLHSHSTCIV